MSKINNDFIDIDYIKNELKEVYSTNEVKTNKIWIDGKPIYRKCFTGTASTNTTFFRIDGISKITDQGGFATYKDNTAFQFPVSSHFGTDGTNAVRLIKSTSNGYTGLSLQLGNNTIGQHFECWAEYTKTTD